MEIPFTVGNKTFVLDRTKAEAAFAGKRVINGRQSAAFNLLPLKYTWAYDIYQNMKANHWEPEEITMQKDVEQWRSGQITDNERWIIRMGIGYFSAAEGIVGDNIQSVVREMVTAPELKLVLGRRTKPSVYQLRPSHPFRPEDAGAVFGRSPRSARAPVAQLPRPPARHAGRRRGGGHRAGRLSKIVEALAATGHRAR